MFASDTIMAQTAKYREMHKVKRKETVFGIARDYGLTVQELINANPDMNKPGYELRKGDYIFIPYPSTTPEQEKKVAAKEEKPADDVRLREVRVGVMLPLHDINGDGKRMVEYYRGLLMAVDSMKQVGTSVDIRAWNLAEDGDISKILADKYAADRDIIVGPLYSKQVKALSDFVEKHDIKLLIPFSIVAPQTATNSHIFQVYKDNEEYNDIVLAHFAYKFANYHVVIIDCNDAESDKGAFTAALRKKVESKGKQYSITNLKSSEEQFVKAFSQTEPNVVVLNTGRSPELNVAFAKLNNLTMNNPKLNVTMFGYTEWMMYTKYVLDNLYKYNAYIPAAFYRNPLSSKTARIEQKYRWNFHADMMQALPRFATTGFDHGFFFFKGLKKYGKAFDGSMGTQYYHPIQTPLRFERVGNGGYKNKSILFVHYTPEHKIETIYY